MEAINCGGEPREEEVVLGAALFVCDVNANIENGLNFEAAIGPEDRARNASLRRQTTSNRSEKPVSRKTTREEKKANRCSAERRTGLRVERTERQQQRKTDELN